MRQLKKISLQKEELVSLNSPQMDLIKGGVGTIFYDDYYSLYGPYIPDDPYVLIDILIEYGMVEYTSQWVVQGTCLMKPLVVYP